MLAKFREHLLGWKTIIVARIYVLGGLLVALYDLAVPYVAGVDWSPLISHFPAWAYPLFIALTGIAFELLRRATTGPVGSKGQDAPPPETKAGD